jgi:hypothetical protein
MICNKDCKNCTNALCDIKDINNRNEHAYDFEHNRKKSDKNKHPCDEGDPNEMGWGL